MMKEPKCPHFGWVGRGIVFYFNRYQKSNGKGKPLDMKSINNYKSIRKNGHIAIDDHLSVD